MTEVQKKSLVSNVVSGLFGLLGDNQANPINHFNPTNPSNPEEEIKILSLFNLNRTIKEAYDIHVKENGYNKTYESFLYNIKRSRGNKETGFYYEGLLEEVIEDNKTKYILSNKGQGVLTAYRLQQERRKEQQLKKIEYQLTQQAEIQKLKDFFSERVADIVSYAPKGVYPLPFNELAKCDPSIGEDFLSSICEEKLRLFQILISELPEMEGKIINKVRVYDLPKSSYLRIGEKRAKHIGSPAAITGSIISVGPTKTKTESSKWECPSCGNIFNQLQLDGNVNNPEKCGCGRKGKFILISKEITDVQFLTLEENNEDLGQRANPSKALVLLKDDLCHYDLQPIFENNKKIIINGIFKENPLVKKKEALLEEVFEAFSIEVKDEYTLLKLSEEDLERNKTISLRADREALLLRSFAPKLYNLDFEKKAVILSCVSGGNPDAKERDDSHLAMVSNPGGGKSELLCQTGKVFIVREGSGKTSTGVGLVGSVQKNEALGTYELKKNLLASAHGGIATLDELDKASEENQNALLEPLENQKAPINKANISATLHTDMTLIGALNPVGGKFNGIDKPYQQIGLIPPLKDRFDLIIVFDSKLGSTQGDIIKKILGISLDLQFKEEIMEYPILSKYFYHARSLKPVMNDSAKSLIAECYLFLKSDFEKSQINDFLFSYRQLHALRRLTLANAKLRLSDEATIEDAKAAINILTESYIRLGLLGTDTLRSFYAN